MIKIRVEDLSESEPLDKETLGRVRGGHSFCGTPPPKGLPDVEKMLAEYLKALPELPTPRDPHIPGQPIPIEDGPGNIAL